MDTRLDVFPEMDLGNDKINRVTATFMLLFHLGAAAALFFFSWKAFLVAGFL